MNLGYLIALSLGMELVCCQVLLPVIKSPRQFTKKVDTPKITDSDIVEAFKAGDMAVQMSLDVEKKFIANGGVIPRGDKSPEATHQRSNQISVGMGRPPDVTERFEGATAYLIKKYNLSRDEVIYGLPNVNLRRNEPGPQAVEECKMHFRHILDRFGPDADRSCSQVKLSSPEFGDDKAPANSKYREIDGRCNNVMKPDTGRANSDLQRLLPPKYDDLISSPRRQVNGNELPSGRVISQALLKEADAPSKQYTHMLMQFGQFTDHDITSSPIGSLSSYQMLMDCCKPETLENSFGPVHPQCLTIDIPANDKFYSKFPNKRCMNFIRSFAALDCQLGPRQHINQRSAALDGSNIYGSLIESMDFNHAARNLRQHFMHDPISQSGELETNMNHTFGDLLPEGRKQMGGLLQCNIPQEERFVDQSERSCFTSGDDRVNEQPGLTAMHTIWMRQHNRLARNFVKNDGDPFLQDKFIYEETRRIVGAQLQYITYNEFLPIVLGDAYMKHFDLYPLKDGYTRYDSSRELSIFQEFSTSAFRFGHSLVQNEFKKVAQSGQTSGYNLTDKFFDPRDLLDGGLSAILTGLFQQPAQQHDNHIAESLVNHLYQEKKGKFGLDLAAINIQRGRDHGINSYTDYLDYCFNVKINSFNDLNKVMNPVVAQGLSKVYKSPADIDLFVGGVSETPLPNAVVGPTFGCIIGLQFNQLKFADRYYFEHGGQSGSFTPSQLSEIKRKTTLTQVICANTNRTINSIQRRVMEIPGFNNNQLITCASLPDLDIKQFPLPEIKPQMG